MCVAVSCMLVFCDLCDVNFHDHFCFPLFSFAFMSMKRAEMVVAVERALPVLWNSAYNDLCWYQHGQWTWNISLKVLNFFNHTYCMQSPQMTSSLSHGLSASSRPWGFLGILALLWIITVYLRGKMIRLPPWYTVIWNRPLQVTCDLQ